MLLCRDTLKIVAIQVYVLIGAVSCDAKCLDCFIELLINLLSGQSETEMKRQMWEKKNT